MSEESLVERIGNIVSLHASAKAVYADPVERDGLTIIPVAKVQWGIGGGGLAAHGRGGAGGGVRAFPAGFIEIRKGEANFRPFRDGRDAAVLAASALAGVALGFLIARRR